MKNIIKLSIVFCVLLNVKSALGQCEKEKLILGTETENFTVEAEDMISNRIESAVTAEAIDELVMETVEIGMASLVERAGIMALSVLNPAMEIFNALWMIDVIFEETGVLTKAEKALKQHMGSNIFLRYEYYNLHAANYVLDHVFHPINKYMEEVSDETTAAFNGHKKDSKCPTCPQYQTWIYPVDTSLVYLSPNDLNTKSGRVQYQFMFYLNQQAMDSDLDENSFEDFLTIDSVKYVKTGNWFKDHDHRRDFIVDLPAKRKIWVDEATGKLQMKYAQLWGGAVTAIDDCPYVDCNEVEKYHTHDFRKHMAITESELKMVVVNNKTQEYLLEDNIVMDNVPYKVFAQGDTISVTIENLDISQILQNNNLNAGDLSFAVVGKRRNSYFHFFKLQDLEDNSHNGKQKFFGGMDGYYTGDYSIHNELLSWDEIKARAEENNWPAPFMSGSSYYLMLPVYAYKHWQLNSDEWSLKAPSEEWFVLAAGLVSDQVQFDYFRDGTDPEESIVGSMPVISFFDADDLGTVATGSDQLESGHVNMVIEHKGDRKQINQMIITDLFSSNITQLYINSAHEPFVFNINADGFSEERTLYQWQNYTDTFSEVVSVPDSATDITYVVGNVIATPGSKIHVKVVYDDNTFAQSIQDVGIIRHIDFSPYYKTLTYKSEADISNSGEATLTGHWLVEKDPDQVGYLLMNKSTKQVLEADTIDNSGKLRDWNYACYTCLWDFDNLPQYGGMGLVNLYTGEYLARDSSSGQLYTTSTASDDVILSIANTDDLPVYYSGPDTVIIENVAARKLIHSTGNNVLLGTPQNEDYTGYNYRIHYMGALQYGFEVLNASEEHTIYADISLPVNLNPMSFLIKADSVYKNIGMMGWYLNKLPERIGVIDPSDPTTINDYEIIHALTGQFLRAEGIASGDMLFASARQATTPGVDTPDSELQHEIWTLWNANDHSYTYNPILERGYYKLMVDGSELEYDDVSDSESLVDGEGSTFLIEPYHKHFQSRNLSYQKEATQSSLWGSGSADRAVDGVTDGVYANQSVTHTLKDDYAWWQVDLGHEADLSMINIYNRIEIPERLTNFYVFVSDTPFDDIVSINSLVADPEISHYHISGQGGYPTAIQMVPGQTGRYVRVQLNQAQQFLSLAEVEVMGSWRKHDAFQTSIVDDNSFYIMDELTHKVLGSSSQDIVYFTGDRELEGDPGTLWELIEDDNSDGFFLKNKQSEIFLTYDAVSQSFLSSIDVNGSIPAQATDFHMKLIAQAGNPASWEGHYVMNRINRPGHLASVVGDNMEPSYEPEKVCTSNTWQYVYLGADEYALISDHSGGYLRAWTDGRIATMEKNTDGFMPSSGFRIEYDSDWDCNKFVTNVEGYLIVNDMDVVRRWVPTASGHPFARWDMQKVNLLNPRTTWGNAAVLPSLSENPGTKIEGYLLDGENNIYETSIDLGRSDHYLTAYPVQTGFTANTDASDHLLGYLVIDTEGCYGFRPQNGISMAMTLVGDTEKQVYEDNFVIGEINSQQQLVNTTGELQAWNNIYLEQGIYNLSVWKDQGAGLQIEMKKPHNDGALLQDNEIFIVDLSSPYSSISNVTSYSSEVGFDHTVFDFPSYNNNPLPGTAGVSTRYRLKNMLTDEYQPCNDDATGWHDFSNSGVEWISKGNTTNYKTRIIWSNLSSGTNYQLEVESTDALGQSNVQTYQFATQCDDKVYTEDFNSWNGWTRGSTSHTSLSSGKVLISQDNSGSYIEKDFEWSGASQFRINVWYDTNNNWDSGDSFKIMYKIGSGNWVTAVTKTGPQASGSVYYSSNISLESNQSVTVRVEGEASKSDESVRIDKVEVVFDCPTSAAARVSTTAAKIQDEVFPEEQMESEEGTFSVYPNPTNDLMTIQPPTGMDVGNLKMDLIDMTGRTWIRNRPFQPVLDLSGYSEGIYLLQIRDDQGMIKFKEKLQKQ
ncbi:discoidin domain-containing protein [Reichenbachiella sp. MALMAid0571]|uniref:galactose-binding domain-containing protein n=1 Tax=Reichenbachiella sp. MALMAid0571 TaxID=3143939 RepID=UPI0032DE4FB9